MAELDFLLSSKLNESQKQAVSTTDVNMLVLAGAGSGKTRVITEKIIHLIRSRKAFPSQVLAITFTNKAADEMKSRVSKILEASEISGLNIRTFHSFGLFFLRMFIDKLKTFTSSFSIVDASMQRSLIKKIIPESEKKDIDLKRVQYLISKLKQELFYPAFSSVDEDLVAKRILGKFYPEKILSYFRQYDQSLRDSNCLDFDDLIGYPVLLLKKHPELREYLARRWKYLLVDEYQDSDRLQEELIQFFVSAGTYTTVVGDDSQSIYGFRGACVENILSFSKRVANVEIVVLEKNYRSTQPILALANESIKNNPVVYQKKLYTDQVEGEKPLFKQFTSDIEEAMWVSENILSLVESGEQLNDIAVLFRSNYQTRLVEEFLLKNAISYRVVKGMRFYERKEIKTIISYLSAIVNHNDRLALLEIINTPPRGLGAKSLEIVSDHLSSVEGGDTFKALSSKELTEKLSKRAAKSLEEFSNNLQSIRDLIDLNESVEFIISEILDKFGLYDFYRSIKDEIEREERLNSLDQFIQAAKRHENQSDLHPLVDFLQYISLSGQDEDKGTLQDSVSLITVHNAKGLEYKNVHIIGLEENVFPHYLSSDEEEVREERRLFYVGTTRAKKKLFLSAALRKLRFGSIETFDISRFIEEVPRDLLHLDSVFLFD